MKTQVHFAAPGTSGFAASNLSPDGSWQPIATAPKDGTSVLLYHPGFKGAFYPRDEQPRWWVDRQRDGSWWQAAPSAMPTHWMHLPAAPGETA